MVTIRYLEPLPRWLGIDLREPTGISRSLFPEWYGSAVECVGGSMIVLVNSATRLSVVTPLGPPGEVELIFRKRLLALYRRLGLPDFVVRHEAQQLEQLAYAAATSRSVVESLEAALRLLRSLAGPTTAAGGDDVESFEIAMSELAQAPLNFRTPTEVARAIVVQHLNAGWSRAG